MSSTLNTVGQPETTFSRLRLEHPEWWGYIAAFVGWLVMAQHWLASTMHHEHAMGGALLSVSSLRVELQAWLMMVCAMMLPTVVHPIRNLVFRSYRRRWNQTRLCFLIGYLLPWIGLGLIYALLNGSVGNSLALHSEHFASLLFAVSAIWALSRAHDRWLDVCRISRPLLAEGWQADMDAHVHGIQVGWACVVVCGIPMMACAATGHAPLAMLVGFVIVWAEYTAFRPPKRILAVGFGALALAYAPWGTYLLM